MKVRFAIYAVNLTDIFSFSLHANNNADKKVREVVSQNGICYAELLFNNNLLLLFIKVVSLIKSRQDRAFLHYEQAKMLSRISDVIYKRVD